MGWDLAPFLNGVTGLPAKSRFSRNWRRCPHLNGRQWPSFAPRDQGVARLVRGHHPSTADLSLVVLTDIIVGPLKKLCVLVSFVLEQRLAKRLLDLPLASMHALPVIATNHLHDLFDVVHYPLENHRRVAVPRLLEQCGQYCLATVDVVFLRRLALGLHNLFCECPQLLQEVDR